VVEFGSGSGNLILPLAHLFPHFTFTAVDMKPSAVRLLQQRVQEVGLTNVTAQLGRIEEFTGVPMCAATC
jgi:tRNA G46 methylase TrmB